LVEHANAVVNAPGMSWSYRVRFAAFAVIGVVMAIFGVIGGSIGLITVGGTLALLILAGKLVSGRIRQRRQERATRSRDATLEQWGQVTLSSGAESAPDESGVERHFDVNGPVLCRGLIVSASDGPLWMFRRRPVVSLWTIEAGRAC
jgi:hypothetical protein